MTGSETLAGLLLLLGLVHLAPEHIAEYTGAGESSVAYVAYGFEATALWAMLSRLIRHPLAWPVCAWGMVEGLQRSACRLMFPMDMAPPSGNMCELALGWEWGAAGLWAVVVLAQYLHLRGLDRGRP